MLTRPKLIVPDHMGLPVRMGSSSPSRSAAMTTTLSFSARRRAEALFEQIAQGTISRLFAILLGEIELVSRSLRLHQRFHAFAIFILILIRIESPLQR